MTLKGLSEKKAGMTSHPMGGSKCDLWARQVLDYIDTAYKWYLDQQSKMQSKNKTRYMYVAWCNVMWIQFAQCWTPVFLDARKWFHRKLMKRKEAFEDTNCSLLQWSCGGPTALMGWRYRPTAPWHPRSGEKSFQSLFFPEKAWFGISHSICLVWSLQLAHISHFSDELCESVEMLQRPK